MDGWMEDWKDGGWKEELMDEWIDGWMDRYMFADVASLASASAAKNIIITASASVLSDSQSLQVMDK